MKKILALLLSVTLLSGLIVGCGSNNNEEEEFSGDVAVEVNDNNDPQPPVEEIAPPETVKSNTPSDTLVVAYGANMNGDFIWGFGNNAYDLSIKELLHGRESFTATYTTTKAGELALNEAVVKDVKTTFDDAGNKTYTFELHQDLKWSDGSSITAEDYIFSLMWAASPQWVEAGAVDTVGYGLLGYNEYTGGETEFFAGAAIVDEYIFSLTIDVEELPYFWETSFVSLYPIHKATFSPDSIIIYEDDGADRVGSRFDGDISADCERIASTSGGERYAPTVVAGPYTFVSFDNQIITLQRNPHFKGDEYGRKPYFEYIVQQSVPEDTDVDILLAGDIDYLPDMIEGDKIERAKAGDNTTTSSYLRSGYGVMNIVNDWGPTADVNVRWAIACLVDRTQLLDQILGGYGGLVDSEHGMAQWMYQVKERELRAALTPIAMNIDKANEYLDQSTWIYEADGSTPFDVSKAGENYLRHNAAGEPLVIQHAAANAAIGAVLEIEFLKNTPLVGMKYNFDNPDFDIILNEWYTGMTLPDEERTYSTFSMGTGFPATYDPYFYYHTDWIVPYFNSSGVSDEKLDELLVAMRQTNPEDKAGFADIWLEYQIRWNEILPSLPLYSNEYFDLYNTTIKSIQNSPYRDWFHLICEIEKF